MSLNTPSSQGNEAKSTLFETQPIPGKGKGLVACNDIPKGTRILCEKPIFTLATTNDRIDSDILMKVKALSKDQQRLYLSLHNNHPGLNVFSGIFKTNALPCGPGSPTGGVYPTICLINHSCVPNSQPNWNSLKSSETIHAVRDIRNGEEITICYCQPESFDTRRTSLRNSFGFDCDCSLCSLSLSLRQDSDARRARIEQLDKAIGDPDRIMNTPGKALADCRELLHVLDEEFKGYANVLDARLYYDAFQVACMHSDQARASVFAGRGYDVRHVCEGGDSLETQRMEDFQKHPNTHRNFGLSKRWRASISAVPKGLSETDFEDWLWRTQ